MFELSDVTEEIFEIVVRQMASALTIDMANDLLNKAVQKAETTDYEFLNNKKKIDDDSIEPKAKRTKLLDWENIIEAQNEYTKSLKQTSFIQSTSCMKVLLTDKKRLIEMICTDNEHLDNKNVSFEANDSLSYSISSALSESGDDYTTDTTENLFEKLQHKSPSHANNSIEQIKESNEASKRKSSNRFKGLKANYNISMCYECANSEGSHESICRFVGWRKLIYDEKENKLKENGFLELNDANQKDYEIWEPNKKIETTIDEKNLEANELKIICYIGKIFMEMVKYEYRLRESIKENRTWKRSIFKTRELCDKCSTTLFNGHFCCKKCGLAVCLNCYEQFLETEPHLNDNNKNKDLFKLPYCSKFELVEHKDKFIFKRLGNFKHHYSGGLIYVQYIPPHSSVYDEYVNIARSKKYKKRLIELSMISKENRSPQNCNWYGSEQTQNNFLVLDSKEKNNSELFDIEWQNRRPILVKNLHECFDQNLWSPQSFNEDFGELVVDLTNCRNHKVVPDIQMKYFWNGFEKINNRMTDERLRPLILKLKDWPTTDDFKHILPKRFENLIKNAPISKYTSRESPLNLVSSLSDFFGKPDLGPKLYIAYGSIGDIKNNDQEGTTNLHVDISDAFNIMMYVGKNEYIDLDPSDKINHEYDLKLWNKKLQNEKKRCEELVKFEKIQFERYLNGEKPGALWHLFRPEDANEIRKFLVYHNYDILGKKAVLKKSSDPIHDQTNYIDAKMMSTLEKKFGIQAFTILQFAGDAIFIPAGSPHQVRNLNSCIKVAGDFVSPQGVEQCLLMTDQFRKLSDKHANKEDKLQIKNMIYHRIKESITILNKLKVHE